MPSPFPGMDPCLEKPSLWPDVHHELISEIRATLNRHLDSELLCSDPGTDLYLDRGRHRQNRTDPRHQGLESSRRKVILRWL